MQAILMNERTYIIISIYNVRKKKIFDDLENHHQQQQCTQYVIDTKQVKTDERKRVIIIIGDSLEYCSHLMIILTFMTLSWILKTKHQQQQAQKKERKRGRRACIVAKWLQKIIINYLAHFRCNNKNVISPSTTSSSSSPSSSAEFIVQTLETWCFYKWIMCVRNIINNVQLPSCHTYTYTHCTHAYRSILLNCIFQFYYCCDTYIQSSETTRTHTHHTLLC